MIGAGDVTHSSHWPKTPTPPSLNKRVILNLFRRNVLGCKASFVMESLTVTECHRVSQSVKVRQRSVQDGSASFGLARVAPVWIGDGPEAGAYWSRFLRASL